MPEETDWLAYTKDLLRQRSGASAVTAIALRVDAMTDEWLRGYLVKLGAEELVRQAQAEK